MSEYVNQITTTKTDTDLYKVMGNICESGELSPGIVDAFIAKGGNLNKSYFVDVPYFWYIFKSRNIGIEYIQGILDHIKINKVYNGYNILLHLLDFGGEYEDRILFIMDYTNIDIDYVSENSFSALFKSCEKQLYTIVEALINAGANLYNEDDDDDDTCVSILIGHINYDENNNNKIYDLLRLIIDKSDNYLLNKKYDDNFTLLSFYASNDRNEEILLLYDRGININDKHFVREICERGNNEIFDLMIPQIDKNIYDPPLLTKYSSPLMTSLMYKKFAIAEKLLRDFAVNVNYYNDFHVSALMSIAGGFDDEALVFAAVKLLLKYNVYLNHQDKEGHSALFYVRSPNILNLLVSYGADINHIDKRGHSVLYQSVKNYNHDLVRAILKFGPSTTGVKSLIKENTPVVETVFRERYNSRRISPEYVYDILPLEHIQCLLEISWELILQDLKDYGVY